MLVDRHVPKSEYFWLVVVTVAQVIIKFVTTPESV
jgi:hypothetical protein